jgi:hypothetical protein
MKASINRLISCLAVLLPFVADAQTVPSHIHASKALPFGHPKLTAHAKNDLHSTQNANHERHPVCVFDEMNEAHSHVDPVFAKELEKHLKETLPQLSANGLDKSMAEPLLTISVVVHVIHNGEPVGQGQNISDAQVLEQIAILNEDYTSLNSQFYETPSQWMGVAGFPNIQFCLANKKPDGSPTNGIDRRQMTVTGTSWNNNNINSTIKPMTNWNPNRYFNIYVLPIPGTTAQGGVVGFANYPIPGQIGGNSDGVVIDYRWFGGPGFPASGYRPLTHETGHYLGLPHPFNGNACTLDDGIADTPNIDGPTRDKATLNCQESYPDGPISCGNEHLYVNYMDYVNENCYTSFTAGQVNVMRAVLNGTSSSFGYGSRNNLIVFAPQQCAIPSLDAGIVRVVEPNNLTCTNGNQITPLVSLRNFGTSDLTAATIHYRINNGPTVSYSWQGNLFPGENENLGLAPFMVPNGAYSISVWTTQPNGQSDQRTSNDTVVVNRFNFLVEAPPSFEDFESEAGFPTSESMFQVDFSQDGFVWQLSNDASGFGQGNSAALFDNFNDINGTPIQEGALDLLITKHFDFTNIQNAMLKFDVAYTPILADLGDTLYILASTECALNFENLLYKKGGEQLATAPVLFAEFTPTAGQWRTETIDLSAFDGLPSVTLTFLNKSNFSNRLFLDNIGVGSNCASITTSTTGILPDDCSAACTGSATVQVSNANGNLQYHWEGFPNVTGPTNNQLCSGTTTVTVTDAIGCSKEVEVQIVGQQPANLSTSSTNVTTFGINNGTATVNVTNGTAPYSYSWSNGFQQSNVAVVSSTANNLAPGNYVVTVTNGNGCSSTATIAVGSVCNGFGIALTPTMPSCFGGANGSISINPTAGTQPFSYNWGNGQTSAAATNLTSGIYSVTVTDANGCPATSQANLQQPAQLVLSMSASPQTLNGVNNGSAAVVVTGGTAGYTYAWGNGGTMATINNLAPATYPVTVTDANGCTATANVTVNSVSCAAFTGILNIGNLDCFGENDGTATVAVNGLNTPFTFQWSNGSTATQLTGLPAGPIAATVTDAIGCVLNLAGTVSQPAQVLANESSTQETFPGAADGAVSVNPSGGVSPYQILWSTGATSNTIIGLVPGNYGYTITDANDCTTNGQVAVTTSTCFIVLEMGATPTSCPDLADGTATVAVAAGGNGSYSINWSNGETTSTITQLTSGTYSVTVSDGLGCTEEGQITLSSADTTPPNLVLYNSAFISLDADGIVTLSPADLVEAANDNCSMLFYEISPAEVGCDDIGPLMVTVTATDNSGNATFKTTTVQVQDLLPPVIVCPNDIAISNCEPLNYGMPTATDNCSSSILLALESGPASGETFPIGQTNIVWSATDESGNKRTCDFTVSNTSSLSVQAGGNDVSCFGYSDGSIQIGVSGGQPPYTISPNDTDQLPAGSYEIQVTDNAGCSLSGIVTISQPDALSLNITNITPATIGQSNGSIEYEVEGGVSPFSFAWLQGGMLLPNFNPNAAPAGMYQARVEDANGCILLSNLITVGSVSSINEAELERMISLSPNPSTGLFYFQTNLPASEPIGLEIFDGAGRLMLRNKFDAPSKMIDLQAFGSGVYWAKIQMDGAVVWRRLVKL